MNRLVTAVLLVCACAGVGLVACGSSSDDGNTELTVTWKFDSGDCTSNGVDKVRVTFGPAGKPGTPTEVACSVGKADVGKISAGSYGVSLEGLDASGTARFTASGSADYPDGKVFEPFDLTLQAKPSNVTVTWKGCPPSVILPYQITLYKAGADGGATSSQAGQTSASCSALKAVVQGVSPGSYIAVLDDQAVTPAVKGSAPVTVTAGQDAEVSIPVP
jgi:hypothetical protein